MVNIRIRAFRAIDNEEDCDRFISGHSKVLDNIGVTKVTSSNSDWKYNPGVFVILAESLDKSKTYGGARVHLFTSKTHLPIVDAVYKMDQRIAPLIDSYKNVGTGEFCGLWNSREVAGLGVGAVFLGWSSVAITPKLGINTLFALCASYTVDYSQNKGMVKEKRIGINGTFYYPKVDLIAQAMILPDIGEFSHADPFERDKILELVNQPNIIKKEIFRKKEINIEYDLTIPKLEGFDFKSLF